MLTRAKCLLIIVGDRKTLVNDKNFLRLINYCIANKALLDSDASSNQKSNNAAKRKASTHQQSEKLSKRRKAW